MQVYCMSTLFLYPLRIGNVRLDNNLALAPLAGTSNLAFRPICRRFGAGLTVTELVSARGVCHDPDFHRNWRYLVFDPAERPIAIQLFGSDPKDFSHAIRRILEHPLLGRCSMIDLNMGCPVNKIVKAGEGAALMRTPDLAAWIIEASVKTAGAFNKPVTVKLRNGWDDDHVNAVYLARRAESAGAAALTIHGRTRSQFYGGQADWSIIGEVKAAVNIPVYGNGDINSPSAARRMIRETGVDGLMIGRAARGNPWIFSWLTNALGAEDPKADAAPGLTPDDKIPVILEHLDSLIDLRGESTAVREMRKQLIFYLSGTPRGAEIKRRAMAAGSRSEILAVLEDWRIKCEKHCEHS
jgi:tRNA-dihydrouridine synthase B